MILYGWQGEEIGRYLSGDIHYNVGLTDDDFALTNPRDDDSHEKESAENCLLLGSGD